MFDLDIVLVMLVHALLLVSVGLVGNLAGDSEWRYILLPVVMLLGAAFGYGAVKVAAKRAQRILREHLDENPPNPAAPKDPDPRSDM